MFSPLSYVQTLIFLAENRKPYQIGITVLLAVVYFPQRLGEFEPRQKAICCVRHRPIQSQKKLTKEEGSPGSLFLKQRAVAPNSAPLTRPDGAHGACGAPRVPGDLAGLCCP